MSAYRAPSINKHLCCLDLGRYLKSSLVPSNSCLVRLSLAKRHVWRVFRDGDGIFRITVHESFNLPVPSPGLDGRLVPSHQCKLGYPATAPATKRSVRTSRVFASHPIYHAACKYCSTTTNSGQRHSCKPASGCSQPSYVRLIREPLRLRQRIVASSSD